MIDLSPLPRLDCDLTWQKPSVCVKQKLFSPYFVQRLQNSSVVHRSSPNQPPSRSLSLPMEQLRLSGLVTPFRSLLPSIIKLPFGCSPFIHHPSFQTQNQTVFIEAIKDLIILIKQLFFITRKLRNVLFQKIKGAKKILKRR